MNGCSKGSDFCGYDDDRFKVGCAEKKGTNDVDSNCFSYGSTNTPVPFPRSVANPLFDSFHNNHINFKSTTPSQTAIASSYFSSSTSSALKAFISSAPTMSPTLESKGRGYEMIGAECNNYNNVVISAVRGGEGSDKKVFLASF